MKLKIDPQRTAKYRATSTAPYPGTGLFVRAEDQEGRWQNTDISCLDAKSLLVWLRSRGGYNPWAEQVVFVLLDQDMPKPELTALERVQAGIGVARMWDLEVSADEDSVLYITTKNQADPVPQEPAKQLAELGWAKTLWADRVPAYEMYLP